MMEKQNQIMKTQDKSISKWLSLILRHNPKDIGLILDEHGWGDVDYILSKANFSKDDLIRVVLENDKQRFSFNDDKTKIRANQGHSINIDLDLIPVIPPEYLYHGTVEKSIQSIKTSGLLKRNRQYVHLSEDYETAIQVGQRRGNPKVLTIESLRYNKDGGIFYLSKNGVWLTDFVPLNYILF